jgi:hypothetical protein
MSASGTNFSNVTQVSFTWSGATSGSKTWAKGDANWNAKLIIASDTSITLTPDVVATGDPAGTTNWTVTLTDSSGKVASRSFTVTYTPTTPSLSFTNLSPSTFMTSTAPYTATMSASGTNFSNVTQVSFTWSGATSGSKTWAKGDANWNAKLTIASDTSMTLTPDVVAAGDPGGTTNWTATLTDSSGRTASRNFIVTYTPATPSLSFTNLSPTTFTTSTAPYQPTMSAAGTNFNNITKMNFTWTGATSGNVTWLKGDINWNAKVAVTSNISMTIQPVVVFTGDPAGTTNWTLTLTDSSNSAASRNFTVSYTPPLSLTFTNLTPTAFTTSTAPYTATMSAAGANFNNVAKVNFTWIGATGGNVTWLKGDANWNAKVTVSSNTSLTLQPVVVSTGDPGGTTNWTVTLTDGTSATASRTFAVTYTPIPTLSFTNLTPSTLSTSTVPYQPTLSATGANFSNVTKVNFTWSGATSGNITWLKGDTNWNAKVTVISNTSMTLQPVVAAAGDPHGTTHWTVTLTDASNASASRTFTVTY